MQFVIFIGPHKVGSSQLQDFLYRNYVRLIQSGILYPMIEAEGLSFMVSKAIIGDIDDIPLPVNAREAHNAFAYKMISEVDENRFVPPKHTGLPRTRQMFRAIKKQIEFVQPEAVILASEVFSTFGVISPRLIQTLLDEFPDAHFRIIANLRRVDNYLASWHGERLKAGERLHPLGRGGLEAYYDTTHFDYSQILEPWSQAMPDADFVLRDFSAVRPGGTIEDFKEQSCLNFPQNLTTPAPQNPTMHRAVQEIVRRGNAQLMPEVAQNLRDFLETATPDLDLPKSSEIEMYGASLRAEMYDRFEDVHDFLCDMTGQTPFFANLQNMLRERPIPESDATALAVTKLRTQLRGLPDPDARAFIETFAL